MLPDTPSASPREYERQVTPFDCGRTALLAIVRAYGIDGTALESVDKDVPMSLYDVCQYAERLGFAPEAVRIRPPHLPQVVDRLPCLLMCRSTARGYAPALHYIVLISVADQSATILDPNHGVHEIPYERLTKAWTGIAILFTIPKVRSRSRLRRHT